MSLSWLLILFNLSYRSTLRATEKFCCRSTHRFPEKAASNFYFLILPHPTLEISCRSAEPLSWPVERCSQSRSLRSNCSLQPEVNLVWFRCDFLNFGGRWTSYIKLSDWYNKCYTIVIYNSKVLLLGILKSLENLCHNLTLWSVCRICNWSCLKSESLVFSCLILTLFFLVLGHCDFTKSHLCTVHDYLSTVPSLFQWH